MALWDPNPRDGLEKAIEQREVYAMFAKGKICSLCVWRTLTLARVSGQLSGDRKKNPDKGKE